ncbi:MAG: PepSY domain-containing protein, partial [Bradyrhizobium sp.]
MKYSLTSGAFVAVCLMALPFVPASRALAQNTASQSQRMGDLSSFRSIAVDTLAIVNSGNLPHAKTRISDLETSWDKAETKLRPRDPEQWRIIDKAIDAALTQLRADKPRAIASKDALQALLGAFDQSKQSAAGALATPATPPAPGADSLSVVDIITAVEKLRAGAAVLDVSFEPKEGQPLYAVRAYANGKVWDGLIDATSGAAVDEGTVIDESALDAEDKAELMALRGA